MLKNVSSVDYVISALKVLADNEYSLLWELVEDFKCNGHLISVKDSHKFKQVIIDGRYEYIGGDITVGINGGKMYKDPLDYVRDLLSNNLEISSNEMIDFGSGTKKEIREAIANNVSKVRVNEDRAIKIFSRSSEEYKKLSAAANLLKSFTGNEYYVDDTYFDRGQDWKWTTILKKSAEWGTVQALSPRDQENIIAANNAKELGDAVDKVIHRKSYIPQS